MSEHLPQITIIYFSLIGDPLTANGILLTERIEMIEKIGKDLGFQIKLIDSEQLFWAETGDREIADSLSQSQAIWWCGRTAYLPETNKMWRALYRHLNALSLDIPVYDTPQAVDNTFNLAFYYPKLKELGIPQAKTKFIFLSEEEVSLDAEKLEKVLRKYLRWIWIPRKGIFFRTFYNTKKIGGGFLNISYCRKSLVEMSKDLVISFRRGQSIGGIALRQVLSIESYCDWELSDDCFFSRELRVFIAWGKPIFWTYNTRDLDEIWQKLGAERLTELRYSEKQFTKIYEISLQLGKVFTASLVVGDFAILENGEVVLIEVNPGHCSGWVHSIAYFAVYGRFLQKMVGIKLLSREQIMELANKFAISTEGVDIVCGFFEGY